MNVVFFMLWTSSKHIFHFLLQQSLAVSVPLFFNLKDVSDTIYLIDGYNIYFILIFSVPVLPYLRVLLALLVYFWRK